MAARHSKHDRRSSRLHLAIAAVLFAVAFAAVAAAAVVHMVDGEATASGESGPPPAAVQQPLSQEGRIIAVTPTSVTAQSADGFARTYTITSETNAITTSGSMIGEAGATFAVNDEVAIVGVVRDGNAIATAVADKQVTNLEGPPMDAI